MRIRLLAFLPILLLFVGCASSARRYEPLSELSAAPVSDTAWGKMIGNYSGPVRSHVHTWMGTTGEKSEEISLSIRGTPLHPRLFLRIISHYTTSWTGLGTTKEVFTNIPRMEYGAKVLEQASTHAPDAMVIEVPKRLYILRFICRDSIEVDELGIHGWRGTGRLQRIPEFPCPSANLEKHWSH